MEAINKTLKNLWSMLDNYEYNVFRFIIGSEDMEELAKADFLHVCGFDLIELKRPHLFPQTRWELIYYRVGGTANETNNSQGESD